LTVWPGAVTVVGRADFTMVSDGDWVVVTVAVDGGDVTVPPEGVVPETVAELSIRPRLKSAAVETYVAVHVVDPPGARVVVGQLMVRAGPAGAVKVSAMEIPVIVTLPLFVTRNE
jgi:hypothetical protein